MERSSATFWNGKYIVLKNVFYTKFHHIGNKSDKTWEYQPDESDDYLIESNHKECSYQNKLN